MSADIEKLAVFDSRIVQSRPKYAVEKGALSLTNAPFNAIAATQSQHTYNIYVPSENVYVDRAIEWSSTVAQTFQLSTVPGQALVPGEQLFVFGRDGALCAFPLNNLCSTLTATINDTTSVINSQDVLYPVLRLADYKKNRLQRTCPSMLDKYANYNDAVGAVNNPLAGYQGMTDPFEPTNGSFFNVDFTLANGTSLKSLPNGTIVSQGVVVPAPTASADQYVVNGGVPCYDGVHNGPWSIYFVWRSTEKVVLSPFVFADCHEWDTGLFGINNIQLIMNLRSPDQARILRTAQRAAGRIVAAGSLAYNAAAQQGSFSESVVNVMFLTPSLDVPLPPKSVVPYMEFPRYITQYQNGTIAPGDKGQIVSQTITLPQIPDLFIIYAKPAGYSDYSQGDWYFPVATRADGVANPLTINFDNFSGLLSSTTPEQLYSMCVKNGLEMPFDEWVGYAHGSGPNPALSPALGAGRIQTTGGILVLKPSQDITLQTGQAPSLVGNFTFQFNLTVKNTSAVPQTPQLYVITANSGFFESIRGSSRIIKGVLSEQDIISAPLAPMGTRDMLSRYVGGAFNFGNMLSKAKDLYSSGKQLYDASKPLGSAVKGMLPEGKVKSAMGAIGYGGYSGGESGGRSGGMARRLM